MNSKENWLAIFKGEDADRIPYAWEPFIGEMDGCFLLDPQFLSDQVPYGGSGKDSWGVEWMWHEGAPGPHPVVNAENAVIKDIEHWKEQLVVPDPSKLDWGPVSEYAKNIDRDEHLVISFTNQGLFERSHALMGMEEALVAYMTNPDEMYELIGAICDFKIQMADLLAEYTQPDIMLYLDDWGNAMNLFLPPDVWREIIKPHQKRLVDHVHSKGALYMHHADCICTPILEDMIELGIDIWQGVITENDIPKVGEQVAGRMALMGGIRNSVIDAADANEESIKTEVKRAIDEYGNIPRFFPCLPSLIWPVVPENNKYIVEEMTSYGKEFYQEHHK